MTIEPRHNRLALQKGLVMTLSEFLSVISIFAFNGLMAFSVAMIINALEAPHTPRRPRAVRYHGRSAR